MIQIKLSDKEWIAVIESGIKLPNRRKIFGTTGIGQKIFEQVEAQMEPTSFRTYRSEWKKTAFLPTPPKVKKSVAPLPKGVWRAD